MKTAKLTLLYCFFLITSCFSFAQTDSVTTVVPVDDIFGMSLDKLMNLDLNLETGNFIAENYFGAPF